MNFEKQVIEEVSYLRFELPNYLFKAIKFEVEELIQNNFKHGTPYNYTLAGAIQHEYSLPNSARLIEDFFLSCGVKHNGKRLQLTYNTEQPGEKLGPDLWVNFQKRGEYNPIHNHRGEFSFVAWIKIPYNLEDEQQAPNMQSGTSLRAPSFSFVYSPMYHMQNYHVETHHIIVDKSFEGKGIIFPAWLQHMVTPFYTSDDYRISVSGNFTLVD